MNISIVMLQLYGGKERDRVLRMCGWPVLDNVTQLDTFIDENLLEMWVAY